ncbi:MAG: metal-sulfur cluster assembly factor [Spirochaetales bacterium]|nr:metal-sulfur cluster assembly factor [Spirochaetales bacterium]
MISRNEIIDALRKVEDPEMLMSIIDLGLVYRAEVVAGRVEIDYTLTFPGCPLSEVIERDIVEQMKSVTDLEVRTRLVWEPRWSPDYMSDEAKISLGYPV